jgi:chromatin remodeling complex protein RSC6
MARTAPQNNPPRERAPASANSGLSQPVSPSETLAEVVGAEPAPRAQITKRLWDYIKRHQLQDSANKRLINADEKLRKVFGGKDVVSMFEMTKLVNKHLARAPAAAG